MSEKQWVIWSHFCKAYNHDANIVHKAFTWNLYWDWLLIREEEMQHSYVQTVNFHNNLRWQH